MQVEGTGGDGYNPAMSLTQRIAFIGAGNMTEALVHGLLKGGLAGVGQLYATDPDPERGTLMRDRYGIMTGAANRDAASWGDVVVLSVEPQVLDAVLDDLAPVIGRDTLLISVAAGYPIARVAGRVKAARRIVRAMPNTPSGVLAGVTAFAAGAEATEEDVDTVRTMFQSVGTVVQVEERLLDAVTGLSGSGPAYVYVAIEALADGGVKQGLSRAVAETLAAQTLLGAARMVLETGEHPGRLKDRVTSPGGTTIAGLHELERGRLRATLISAVEAATKRSQDLGMT